MYPSLALTRRERPVCVYQGCPQNYALKILFLLLSFLSPFPGFSHDVSHSFGRPLAYFDSVSLSDEAFFWMETVGPFLSFFFLVFWGPIFVVLSSFYTLFSCLLHRIWVSKSEFVFYFPELYGLVKTKCQFKWHMGLSSFVAKFGSSLMSTTGLKCR